MWEEKQSLSCAFKNPFRCSREVCTCLPETFQFKHGVDENCCSCSRITLLHGHFNRKELRYFSVVIRKDRLRFRAQRRDLMLNGTEKPPASGKQCWGWELGTQDPPLPAPLRGLRSWVFSFNAKNLLLNNSRGRGFVSSFLSLTKGYTSARKRRYC